MEPTTRLTVSEAYVAMFKYLEHLYGLTRSDDLGGILGSMSLLSDGQPADPAVWADWNRIVQQVLERDADITLKLTTQDR